MDAFFNPTTCIIYLAISLVVLIAEAFIPSFGVLSVVSVIFAIAAIISGFWDGESLVLGFSVLGIVLIGFPAIIVFIFKNLEKFPLGRILILPKPESPKDPQAVENQKLIGKTGIVLSPLRPSGIAKINGERMDVLSDGELIEKDSQIVVDRIEGNRIYVVEKRQDSW